MRLTKRNADGIACSALPFESSTYDLVDKLAKYEDTGLSPEEIKEKTEGVLELYDKLKPYADAEEQGRLVILPCKVGDMAYYRRGRDIIGDTVERIIIDGIDNQVLVGAHRAFMFCDFGRNVFLTRKEAEAALKGGQDDV